MGHRPRIRFDEVAHVGNVDRSRRNSSGWIDFVNRIKTFGKGSRTVAIEFLALAYEIPSNQHQRLYVAAMDMPFRLCYSLENSLEGILNGRC